MTFRSQFILVTLLLSFACAVTASDKKEDVTQIADTSLSLKDNENQSVQPFKVTKGQASVLLFALADCPISNAYSPELSRIQEKYTSKGVRFFIVYTDPDRTKKAIDTHLSDYGLKGFTPIHDKQHLLVKATGAVMTPEVAVIDSSGTIAYRGRINDQYAGYGKRKKFVKEHNLRDAIDAVLAGRSISKSRVPALGCYIPPLD